MAAARPSSSASSSSLTAIRSAWKTRVAGWVRRRTLGFGGDSRSMSAARSSADSIGAVTRAATIALAYFHADGSSPYLRNSAASSSADSVASSSAAGTPRVASKRMSSGPPVRNPKPRARSASWNDESPRSNSIPSTAPKPAAGATVASSRKFERRSTRRSPNRSRRLPTRSIAAWSASNPRTRPSGLAASRIRSVCPPPPTVASIWRLPGRGDRVPSAEDECLGLEPGKGPKVGRDEDATLAVELRLEGTREQLPLEQPGVRVGHGQAADLRRQLVPCRHRKDREAGVEPPRHDHAPGELRTEARRDGEAPLVVDRMPVLAGEHRS